MGELIFNACLLLAFIAMTFYSGTIKIWHGFIGARYYPMFLLIVADVLFGIKTYKIFKNLPKEKRIIRINWEELKKPSVIRLLVAFLCMIIYVIILPIVGFFLGTFLCAGVLSYIIGLRKIIKLILVSLMITLIVYAVFVWGLNIMFPRGVVPIYYFNLWLEQLL